MATGVGESIRCVRGERVFFFLFFFFFSSQIRPRLIYPEEEWINPREIANGDKSVEIYSTRIIIFVYFGMNNE